MSGRPRVMGVVVARDEWPLLALSVTHALRHHVDEVHVVDHASTDRTAAGLRELAERWPGRLRVWDLRDPKFDQAATTALAVWLAVGESSEWVYVFDADEFMLTPEAEPLGEVLGSLDPDASAVRYPLENWVAPFDFDEARPDHYLRLDQRAVASRPEDLPFEAARDGIRAGEMSFLDAAFPSKIIVRNDPARWLVGGAHALQPADQVATVRLPRERLRAGHLPFLSRRRLADKARYGAAADAAGLPPATSWHLRLIHEFDREGRLAEFWESHSVGAPDHETGRVRPTTVEDLGLLKALSAPLAEAVDRGWIRREPNVEEESRRPAHDSVLPLKDLVRFTRQHQRVVEDSARARNGMAVQLAVEAARAAALADEVDRLRRRLSSAEPLAGQHQPDLIVALAERDAARAERDAVFGSRTWRATGWVRRLGALLHRGFRA